MVGRTHLVFLATMSLIRQLIGPWDVVSLKYTAESGGAINIRDISWAGLTDFANDFCLAFWVKIISLPGPSYLIGFYDSGSEYSLFRDSDNYVSIHRPPSPGVKSFVMNDEAWYHVVFGVTGDMTCYFILKSKAEVLEGMSVQGSFHLTSSTSIVAPEPRGTQFTVRHM